MYAKDTLGVIDNENIRPSLMQSGDSVYFFDDIQAFIMVDTVFGFYAPVGYTLQVVGVKYTDFKAEDSSYDNVTSGRTATQVQEALDEAFSEIDTKASQTDLVMLDVAIKANADAIDAVEADIGSWHKSTIATHEQRLTKRKKHCAKPLILTAQRQRR